MKQNTVFTGKLKLCSFERTVVYAKVTSNVFVYDLNG